MLCVLCLVGVGWRELLSIPLSHGREHSLCLLCDKIVFTPQTGDGLRVSEEGYALRKKNGTQITSRNEPCTEHFHVTSLPPCWRAKNNTFSLPWEIRSIFMQNCFIVSWPP